MARNKEPPGTVPSINGKPFWQSPHSCTLEDKQYRILLSTSCKQSGRKRIGVLMQLSGLPSKNQSSEKLFMIYDS